MNPNAFLTTRYNYTSVSPITVPNLSGGKTDVYRLKRTKRTTSCVVKTKQLTLFPEDFSRSVSIEDLSSISNHNHSLQQALVVPTQNVSVTHSMEEDFVVVESHPIDSKVENGQNNSVEKKHWFQLSSILSKVGAS